MPIAQLNIAQPLAPIDSPDLKDFADNIERINTLAEASEGFIWRLTGETTLIMPPKSWVIQTFS